MHLGGSTCLVTGAAGGIGRAVAKLLAARGASLVLSDRDEAGLSEPAGGTGARTVTADLSTPAGIRALAGEAGPVDVVVHLAGEGYLGAVAELDQSRLERLVALNVTAPIALTAALLPGMLERGRGHVVLVGSIVGRVGRGNEAPYAATKAAVSVFADSLRGELRRTGIGVLLVTPGPVDTAFYENRGSPYDRRRPRPVAPERVARALVDGIERGRAEVTVPRWLAFPTRVYGAAPWLFRALAARFD